MNPLRLLIVDDEKRIRVSLVNIIKLHYPSAIVVGEAEDLNSAVQAIKIHNPNVVLLDIKMPGGSGFELLKQLSPISFKVIFITAFDNFAIQAFKFSALDYLLKPVISEELVASLQRAEQLIDNENVGTKLSVLLNNINQLSQAPKKIVLNSQDKIQVVALNEIVRCEADRNYTQFFIQNKKPILVSRSLIEYDDMLSPSGFFRCHHSHLVNLSFIDRLEKRDGGTLIMKDGSEVAVASRKYYEVIDILNHL